MTLFVPTVYVLPQQQGYTDQEWHAFVDAITEIDERTLHLIVGRRHRGQRMPWTIQRLTTCGVARDNIRSLARECDWSEAPPAVRDMVMQELGLT